MAPLFTPADGQSSSILPSNSILAAARAIIATRATWATPAPDTSNGSHHTRRTATIIVTIIVVAFVVFPLVLAIINRVTDRTIPGMETPRMPSGHVYGHDEAGSHQLTRLRSGRERPNRQQAEDRASNGSESTGQNTVARPTPVVTRDSDGQEESQPPPPCKQLSDNIPENFGDIAVFPCGLLLRACNQLYFNIALCCGQ